MSSKKRTRDSISVASAGFPADRTTANGSYDHAHNSEPSKSLQPRPARDRVSLRLVTPRLVPRLSAACRQRRHSGQSPCFYFSCWPRDSNLNCHAAPRAVSSKGSAQVGKAPRAGTSQQPERAEMRCSPVGITSRNAPLKAEISHAHQHLSNLSILFILTLRSHDLPWNHMSRLQIGSLPRIDGAPRVGTGHAPCWPVLFFLAEPGQQVVHNRFHTTHPARTNPSCGTDTLRTGLCEQEAMPPVQSTSQSSIRRRGAVHALPASSEPQSTGQRCPPPGPPVWPRNHPINMAAGR